VQFAAYDSFTHVFFSVGIDASFLETCLAQGLITKYQMYLALSATAAGLAERA
jgi:hypothetical protein